MKFLIFWSIGELVESSEHLHWNSRGINCEFAVDRAPNACHVPQFLHANTAKADSRVILIEGLFDLGYACPLRAQLTNYRSIVLNLLPDYSKINIFQHIRPAVGNRIIYRICYNDLTFLLLEISSSRTLHRNTGKM